MSKERLEEIRKDYQKIINLDYEDKFNDSMILKRLFFENHGKWLIEQAERVQELEKKHKEYVSFTESNNYNMDVELEKMYKQNKRYRATINAMGQILKDAIHALDVGEKVQGLEYGVKIANDALESESHE